MSVSAVAILSFKKGAIMLLVALKQLVKQGFKMSNKMKSMVVTLTLLKVHVNPFIGPMVVK
jgi:hypothetical protein